MQKINLNKWGVTIIPLLALCIFSVSSCNKKKDDASSESGYTGVASVALINIDTVQDHYGPDSMEITTGTSTLVLNPLAANFCEGKSIYACQPKLVKLYIAIGKSYLNLMKVFLAGFSKGLSNIQDGHSDPGVAINDRTVIAYSKTTATQYSILARANGESYFYFSSNANTYNLQIDFSKIPAADKTAGDPTQGKVTVTLNYIDSTHWTLSLYAYNFQCNENDPGAPDQVKIVMHKTNNLWNGKAMLANPRSMKGSSNGSVSCTSESNDVSYSSNFYTEFVGDSTATKASVYLMKRDVTSTTSAEYAASYALNNICANYHGNFGIGENLCETYLANQYGEPVSTYANPFCNLKGSNLGTWDNSCAASSSAVSAASFEDPEVPWVSPSSLYTTKIELPTTAQ